MSERNYYVLCEDNCKFPAMTAEQILAAIAEATGNTPSNVDDAFITKIRELNKSSNLRFWIGTTAEFNALGNTVGDCLYILTDDTTAEDIDAVLEEMRADIEALQEKVATQKIIDTPNEEGVTGVAIDKCGLYAVSGTRYSKYRPDSKFEKYGTFSKVISIPNLDKHFNFSELLSELVRDGLESVITAKYIILAYDPESKQITGSTSNDYNYSKINFVRLITEY